MGGRRSGERKEERKEGRKEGRRQRARTAPLLKEEGERGARGATSRGRGWASEREREREGESPSAADLSEPKDQRPGEQHTLDHRHHGIAWITPVHEWLNNAIYQTGPAFIRPIRT